MHSIRACIKAYIEESKEIVQCNQNDKKESRKYSLKRIFFLPFSIELLSASFTVKNIDKQRLTYLLNSRRCKKQFSFTLTSVQILCLSLTHPLIKPVEKKNTARCTKTLKI